MTPGRILSSTHRRKGHKADILFVLLRSVSQRSTSLLAPHANMLVLLKAWSSPTSTQSPPHKQHPNSTQTNIQAHTKQNPKRLTKQANENTNRKATSTQSKTFQHTYSPTRPR